MEIMKKLTVFVALACMMLVVSCKKDNKEPKNVFKATITLSQEIPAAVTYGQPVAIKGTITTKNTLTSCVLTGVKKSGTTYTAAGDPQTVSLSGNTIDVLFFPDTKTMTDIEVTLYSNNNTCKIYYPISSVTGEWNGNVWTNKAAALYADHKVATHDNDPTNYPDEGTGAGSDTKSFFSMPGVQIGGEVKHILSLNELRGVDGKNASCAFINVLQNTSNNAYIGSQRGFAFTVCKKSSLAGGTMGRQCDVYTVNGHSINDANIDINFNLLAVNGSWAGTAYNEALYKYIDALFISINSDIATTADKMRAHYQLGALQRDLDNSTLGVETEPTSLTMKTYLRRWTNAGSSSSSALGEGYRAGDYIIIRTKRGTAEAPVYYYGLMQVSQTYDDSGAFVDGRIDQTKAEELFGKPIYLNIKTQCEL